jgi:hypothetical protein
VFFAAMLCLAGCGGPGRVQYEGGRCFEDGRALTAKQVEAAQADVARRIASRQPWFTVITIGIVLLAAVGNAEKVVALVRARHVEGHRPFVERLRDVLARRRERPALVMAIVGGSLVLIMLAGGVYVYLDIDKRASERALGMLQFCHLALRTQKEEGVLDEQRRNLQAIESTAGDIRALIGKLPPEEQRKAQLIVDQMNSALDKQGKTVGEYIERTDEAQRDLSAHTLAMEKGLASVEGELSELRSLPASLKGLEGAAHRIDETTTAFDGRLGDLRARLSAVDAKLDTLVARPPCPAPDSDAPASAAHAAAGAGPAHAAAAASSLHAAAEAGSAHAAAGAGSAHAQAPVPAPASPDGGPTGT